MNKVRIKNVIFNNKILQFIYRTGQLTNYLISYNKGGEYIQIKDNDNIIFNYNLTVLDDDQLKYLSSVEDTNKYEIVQHLAAIIPYALKTRKYRS